MQQNSYRRWITLAIISFSGGVSFDLAYLRYIYQIPMAKFMGFSNTEIGLIMSTLVLPPLFSMRPAGLLPTNSRIAK
jgi:alkylhydroperoxidase/carboxymuconolactone decarboxylase family protein YurZ